MCFWIWGFGIYLVEFVGAFSISFCTRQLVSSPTRISFSLRQSISCTDAELLHLLAGLAEPSDDLPIQLHLVDLAVIEVADPVRVGAEEVLMRARRDAHRPRRADIDDTAS